MYATCIFERIIVVGNLRKDYNTFLVLKNFLAKISELLILKYV